MRRAVSVVLILAFAALVSSTPIVAAQGQAQTGTLAGKVSVAEGGTVPPGSTVNILNSAGEIVQSVPVGADGAFSVSGLNPGTYSVQLVSSTGSIYGSTAAVSVAAGATTTVAVTAAAAAAAGAAAGMSTLMIAGLVGGGLAVAAATIAVVTDESSPSR